MQKQCNNATKTQGLYISKKTEEKKVRKEMTTKSTKKEFYIYSTLFLVKK